MAGDDGDAWIKSTLGLDPADYAAGAPAAGDDGGGMSGVTPDGAGFSAPGAAPAMSQAPVADDGGGGGMTGVTPDGAGFSAPGVAPDMSQGDGGAAAGGSPAPVEGDGGPSGDPGPGGGDQGDADGGATGAGGGAGGTDAGTGDPETGDPGDGGLPGGTTPAGDGGTPDGGNPDGGAEGAGGGTSPGPKDGDTRPLSGDEQAYAHTIFQDTLDYGAIQINYDGVGAAGNTPRTIGNTIYMTPNQFEPGTFTLTSAGKETLVHEMTHVWQYQHTGWTYAPKALWAQAVAWITTGNRGAAYDWVKLRGDGVPFEDWNPEAQAEAVERYNEALRAVQSGKGTPDDYKDLGLLQPYITAMQNGPKKA